MRGRPQVPPARASTRGWSAAGDESNLRADDGERRAARSTDHSPSRSSAASAAPAPRLTKVSLVGGLSIVASADIRVEVRGFSLVGGKNVERDRDARPDAPVLRVSAWSLVGGVRVRLAG